jgi:hypothetical protein
LLFTDSMMVQLRMFQRINYTAQNSLLIFDIAKPKHKQNSCAGCC